ncbi:hypothetical protein POAN111098_00245 [Polynucleobacter antarcticus]
MIKPTQGNVDKNIKVFTNSQIIDGLKLEIKSLKSLKYFY